MTPEQTAFYVDLFKKLTQTAEYKDYMEKQALKPVFLTGKDMLKFLEEDDTLNKRPDDRSGLRRHSSRRAGVAPDGPPRPRAGQGVTMPRALLPKTTMPESEAKSSSTIRPRRRTIRRR